MDLDLKTVTDMLGQFVEMLKNPAFLIFICSSVVGYVIKNINIPIPNWLIPSILSGIGLTCGWTFLFVNPAWSPVFAVGPAGHFQASILGMTLALASVGTHQFIYQLINRGKDKIQPQTTETK